MLNPVLTDACLVWGVWCLLTGVLWLIVAVSASRHRFVCGCMIGTVLFDAAVIITILRLFGIVGPLLYIRY